MVFIIKKKGNYLQGFKDCRRRLQASLEIGPFLKTVLNTIRIENKFMSLSGE